MPTPTLVKPQRARLPWSLSALLLAAAGAGGCAKNAAPATAVAAPPRTVSAATAVTRDVEHYLDGLGQATAYESVNIVAQVDGQIVSLPFQQGTMVKAGDTLAVLFQEPFAAAVDKAEGQVKVDEANLNLAQETLDRNEKLLPDKLISKQQYDSIAAQVDAIKGQLQVDQALLKTAQIDLQYATIKAPTDGMVGNYRISVGNVVKVNDIPITTVQRMDPIYADFVVSVDDFPALRDHFDANGGKLKVRVTSTANPDHSLDGNLTVLSNAIAGLTGTEGLRATLPNPNHLLWPNEPIRVRIFLDETPNAVLVPESAVQLSQQGPYVFVVAAPKEPGHASTAEKRMIKVGQTQDDGWTIIESGLKAGEVVIVHGQIFLAPDSDVSVSELDEKPYPGGPPMAGTTPSPTPTATAGSSSAAPTANAATPTPPAHS